MAREGRGGITMGWPSGLRRCVKAAVREGVVSNPTPITQRARREEPKYTIYLYLALDKLAFASLARPSA